SELLNVYRRLAVRAIQGPRPPDLVVWPETSYPYQFVTLDPGLAPEAFERQVRGFDAKRTAEFWRNWMRSVSEQLHGWTDELKVPMLVGAITYRFALDGFSKYNSALLFEPGVATVQSYDKLHLVPFGEYVPLVRTFPWLTVLTPYHGGQVPSLAFGGEP